MSDDPNQETNLSNYDSPPQEYFGPPFPEEAGASQPVLPNYAMPSTYINMPAQPTYNAPTPAPYVAPPATPSPYGYGFPPPTGYAPIVSQPLPLGEAIRQLPRQYWRILRKPSAATFAAEQGKAAWNIIWIQLLGMALFSALFVLLIYTGIWFFLQAFLISTMRTTDPTLTNSPNFLSTLQVIFWVEALVAAFMTLILVPVSFFIGTGINYLIGKAFGGTATFMTYCYGSLLVVAPISIITSILTLLLIIVPFGGVFVSLAGSVYQIVLLIFMTMAVHRLSGGKASATILIPALTGYVLVIGLFAAYIAFIFTLISAHP